MKENKYLSELRKKAQRRIKDDKLDISQLTQEEIKEIMQELSVQKIELEIQNEELRNIQQQLQGSRDYFRHLFFDAKIPYLLLDKTGQIVLSNNAFAQLMNKTHEALEGKYFADYLEEPSRHMYLSRYKAIYKKPQDKKLELSIKDFRDNMIDFSLSASIFEYLDESEEKMKACLLIGLIDISDKNQKDREKTQQIERLTSINSILQTKMASRKDFLDNALNEAIRITDSKYGYIYLYDEKTKQFELNTWSKDVMDSCKIVEPQTCYELDKTGIWGEVVRQKKTILINDFKSPHPKKKGYPEGHVELSRFLSVPVWYKQKIIAVVGVANKAVDYNEMDQVQLNLLMDTVFSILRSKADEMKIAELESKSKKEYSFRNALMSALPIPIFYKDVNGIFIGCNQAFEDLMGVSRQEITGKTVYDLWPRELAEKYDEKDKELIKSAKKQVYEFKVKDASGELKEVIFAKDVFRNEQNEVIGIVGSYMDISQKIQFMESLQQTQKIESLGILAGGIAHDFNNLLTGIYGYIDLSLSMSTDEELNENLEFAIKSLDRAKSLTQQMITFSKGGAPELKTINIKEKVKDLVNFSLSGSMIKPVYHIQDDLWNINADIHQISQVIDNLVINAKQAMDDRGNLTVRCENVEVRESDEGGLSPGKYVCINIQDKGPGISPEMISKIFDPFFTTKKKGSGLGLSTAYSILKKHKGTITVSSKEGKGSSFEIFVPASGESIPEKQNPGDKSELSANGTVVILDDEVLISRLVDRVLKKNNIDGLSYPEGRQLLDNIQKDLKSPLLLFILDLTIPGGLGGLDIVQDIKKMYPGVKIIVSSGYSDNPVMADPEKYGFDAKLQKPYTNAELRDIIMRYM